MEQLLSRLESGAIDQQMVERLGALLFSEGMKTEAIQVFELYGTQRLITFSSLYFLGAAYFEKRKLPEAEVALLKAFTLRPEHPECLLKLMLVYLERGNFLESLRIGLIGLRQGAEDAELHFYVALALYNLQKYQKAEQHARACIESRGDHARAWNLLGNICRKKRELVEAQQCYQSTLRSGQVKEPTFEAVVWLNLALASLELRRFSAAATQAERVALLASVAMRPYLVQYGLHRLIKNQWISKGLSCLEAGESQAATQNFLLSIKESPGDPCLVEHLHILQLVRSTQSGLQNNARKDLETALALTRGGKRDRLSEILIELAERECD